MIIILIDVMVCSRRIKLKIYLEKNEVS